MRLSHVWLLMLTAIPIAFLLHFFHYGPLALFLASGLGIIPLAAFMGRATEALAVRLGPQIGALLSASFGNAAELILGLVALNRGLYSVVKASLTGSILGNALLVLGLSLLIGGLKNGHQCFNRVAVGLQSTLLVMASIGLAIPSVLYGQLNQKGEINLSEEVAGVFLLTYFLSLIFSWLTRSESGLAGGHDEETDASHWSIGRAAVVLVSSTLFVIFLSEFLVDAIEKAQADGLLDRWGMSEVFVGVVLVAVVGNAAENSTAIVMAYRNKIDIAFHIAVGSSLQIALLVVPLLVFSSFWIAPQPLDLHFSLLELLAVGASVLVVALVAADGQSHWMEGVLLLAVYFILALAFYHVPAHK